MLLLGEGSEATEPYNKYDKIRPHSIRSLQIGQKVRPLSFRPEKFDLFTATFCGDGIARRFRGYFYGGVFSRAVGGGRSIFLVFVSAFKNLPGRPSWFILFAIAHFRKVFEILFRWAQDVTNSEPTRFIILPPLNWLKSLDWLLKFRICSVMVSTSGVCRNLKIRFYRFVGHVRTLSVSAWRHGVLIWGVSFDEWKSAFGDLYGLKTSVQVCFRTMVSCQGNLSIVPVLVCAILVWRYNYSKIFHWQNVPYVVETSRTPSNLHFYHSE